MANEVNSDWRAELGGILGGRSRMSRAEQEAKLFSGFLGRVVKPAMNQLAEELRRHGREASVRENPASIGLVVSNGGTEEIYFRVISRAIPSGVLPYAEIRMNKSARLLKTEASFRDVGTHYTIDDITQEDVIHCFLKHYRIVLDATDQG